MADIVICVIIAVAVGTSTAYIIKIKRNGKKCIGCPMSDNCNHKCKK